MTELYRRIGNTVDAPASNIGVGARDRLYVWAVKKLTGRFDGIPTGKGLN